MDINIKKINNEEENIEKKEVREDWDMPVLSNIGREIGNIEKDSSSKFQDSRPKISEIITSITAPAALMYWKNASRLTLILFAALAPIFFLPFTALPVAVHKEVLVFGLILVVFFAMLGRILLEGRIRYPGHLLTLALLVLVLVWGASAFFSANQIGSLMGAWATPDSFFAVFLFAALTLSIVITFDKRDIVLSLLVFLASLSVLGIFELLQLVKIFILPYDFTKIATFNPIGSVNDLGVVLAFGLVMASGLMATPEMSKALKRMLGVSAVVFILLLAVIDFWAIWVGLALAMIFMISFLSLGLAKSEFRSPNSEVRLRDPQSDFSTEIGLQEASDFVPGLQLAYFQKAWLPSIILLVSLLLLFIPSPLGKFIQTPIEVSPNFSATLNIANQNLKAGNYLLGSGPNTFGYIFNLYKPTDINQTIFWSTVFNTGASAMATWVGTVGILGILSLLFLIAAFVWTGIKGTAIRNASRGIMNVASQSIFVGVSFLFIMWFLYVVNFTTMALTFWGMGLFLAASLFFIQENDKTDGTYRSVFREYRIFNSPPKTFLFSLLIVGLMVGAVSGIYFETNRYIAEVYFGKAIKASAQNNSKETIGNISKAIGLWKYDERYFQGLAQAVFFQLNPLLARKDLTQEALRDQFQNITTNSISAAKAAQNLDLKNPTNAVLIGSIYENLIPFIADAANFALSSYSTAVSVDPKNPSHHLALARVSIALKDLDKAAAHLEEAIKLKNDYAPAIFLLVQVYDGQGKIPDAVKRAEEFLSLDINDVGALFQLGFLYYKNNEFDKSRQALERAVELSANYSNARYFLGLIYDRESVGAASAEASAAKAKAIAQFEKVSELNPDNSEIKQILTNLKAKKPALAGIAPPLPAPQNRAEAPVSEGIKTPVQPLKK